ncbi:MAG: leucine-rich repeat domain-containing protein [Planctomycetes bacterium]|nr:leucine-rich repeat domain-containing protein [Planctomycetota bacterium]
MIRRRVYLGLLVVMMGLTPCFAQRWLVPGFEDEGLSEALIDAGAASSDGGSVPPWRAKPGQVITLEGTGIWSLKGLDQAVNLCAVSLTDGTFSDISTVTDLTKLTYVDFRRNAVRDITPLAGLAGLEVLLLDGNRVVDLGPVAGLERLWWLHLADNSLQDIAALAALTGLQRLDLRGNPLNAEAYDTWLPLIEANNPGIELQYDGLIPRADADMDGDVDLDDFTALKNAFGGEGDWRGGDFDGDGEVTLDDFVILKLNYGAPHVPIPEPASLSLLILGTAAVLKRRGRRAGR